MLRPCAIVQVVQQIGTDVDGSIVITIPATETFASSAVAVANAPQWNVFMNLNLLIHITHLQVCDLDPPPICPCSESTSSMSNTLVCRSPPALHVQSSGRRGRRKTKRMKARAIDICNNDFQLNSHSNSNSNSNSNSSRYRSCCHWCCECIQNLLNKWQHPQACEI